MAVLDLIFVERKHDANKKFFSRKEYDQLLRRYEVFLNLFDAFLAGVIYVILPAEADNKVRL